MELWIKISISNIWKNDNQLGKILIYGFALFIGWYIPNKRGFSVKLFCCWIGKPNAELYKKNTQKNFSGWIFSEAFVYPIRFFYLIFVVLLLFNRFVLGKTPFSTAGCGWKCDWRTHSEKLKAYQVICTSTVW